MYTYNIYAYIHTHVCTCIFAYIYMQTQTHIGMRLDDTKTAPYCFFIHGKTKNLTKMY